MRSSYQKVPGGILRNCDLLPQQESSDPRLHFRSRVIELTGGGILAEFVDTLSGYS